MMKTAMVRLHAILDSPEWQGVANLVLMVRAPNKSGALDD